YPMTPPPPRSTLFPYTTLFRSRLVDELAGAPHVGLVGSRGEAERQRRQQAERLRGGQRSRQSPGVRQHAGDERTCGQAEQVRERSEEHTSELQSLAYLVCRLLL